MHLFTEYIQPLTTWLYHHPHWALFITFCISMTESLAIIGSIIPGSVTMTAIGILAGSGVMRVDLTLIAAALGAIAGDSASYLLGYTYSERLTTIWPFSRYPSWLDYGKDYFARHGGKSVLIGRFVGPLRSIIPVIAGMLHMSHLNFFIANSLSGVAWALLHVLPGVLIGAASSELSPEAATRLFLLILFTLVGIWLMSIILKWLILRLSHYLRLGLHNSWFKASRHPYLARTIRGLTPPGEQDYYLSASLFLLLIIFSLLFFIVSFQVYSGGWLDNLNQPIHLFLQSLRTHTFDIFFIIINQITSPLTLICLIMAIALIIIYQRDWRSLAYWFSLNFFLVVSIVIMQLVINTPRPEGLWYTETNSSYPLIELSFATTLFASLLLFINTYCKQRLNALLNIVLPTVLILAGLAFLYLGDNWFTDCLAAYLGGFSLCLVHWIFYRRYKPKLSCPSLMPLMLFLIILAASALSCITTYESNLRNHQPYYAQYVVTEAAWWNQRKPILPIYRTNRIGKRISLFNLQYAGGLNHLESALKAYGWQKQSDSLFHSVLTRVGGKSASSELPLMAQLYLNKKPSLVMTYIPKDGSPMQVVRFWRSNFHIKDYKQPLWIGSVHPRLLLQKKEMEKNIFRNPMSLIYISDALTFFQQRRSNFPDKVNKQMLPAMTEPVLLLIRE